MRGARLRLEIRYALEHAPSPSPARARSVRDARGTGEARGCRGADAHHVELLRDLDSGGAALALRAEAFGGIPAELGKVVLTEAGGI